MRIPLVLRRSTRVGGGPGRRRAAPGRRRAAPGRPAGGRTDPAAGRLRGCLALAALLLSGCVHLVPSHDAQVESETFAAARAVDRFYLDLLEEDERRRPYSRFKDRYVEIETDLRALVLRNEVRPLNEESAGIAGDILALWVRKKDRHRAADGYASGAARLDRDRFATLFKYALRAERAKADAGPDPGDDGD